MSCPNIDEQEDAKTNEECKENCSYDFDYNHHSSCTLTNKGDYLEIKVDGKNKAVYNGQQMKIESVRLYTPSLHTFNGKKSAAELIVQHSSGSKNILVCMPIVAAKGTGVSIGFFSQIAPFIPSKGQTETVNVKNWSLNNVITNSAFYHYSGTLPYPPCNVKASIILFDKDYASTISPEDLVRIRKQIKPAQKEGSKESFGVREGLVNYNSAGASSTGTTKQPDDTFECNEWEDTGAVSATTKAAAKTGIDWAAFFQSPMFIFLIVIIVCIIGYLILKYFAPWLKTKITGDDLVKAANPEALDMDIQTSGGASKKTV